MEITEGLEEGDKVYYMRSGSGSASENGSGASGDERPEAGGSGEGGMPGGASGGNGDFGNGDMPEGRQSLSRMKFQGWGPAILQ